MSIGEGPMTVSAAEFFQMLRMELRLDSTAHSCLLFYKNTRTPTGRSAITRPNCALGDDRGKESIGQKRFKIYLSSFPFDFLFLGQKEYSHKTLENYRIKRNISSQAIQQVWEFTVITSYSPLGLKCELLKGFSCLVRAEHTHTSFSTKVESTEP